MVAYKKDLRGLHLIIFFFSLQKLCLRIMLRASPVSLNSVSAHIDEAHSVHIGKEHSAHIDKVHSAHIDMVHSTHIKKALLAQTAKCPHQHTALVDK